MSQTAANLLLTLASGAKGLGRLRSSPVFKDVGPALEDGGGEGGLLPASVVDVARVLRERLASGPRDAVSEYLESRLSGE